MATRKALQGVLNNFLGTFTSRYSEYGGYWLFGFLVTEPGSLHFDLLAIQTSRDRGPVNTAWALAAPKFHDQLAKQGLDLSHLRSASVVVEKLPLTVEGQVNGRSAVGYRVRVVATAISDLGKPYQSERSLFVAPHNPRVEFRSATADNHPLLRTVAVGILSLIGKLLGRGPSH